MCPASGNFLGCVSGMKSPWRSAALDHCPGRLAHRWGAFVPAGFVPERKIESILDSKFVKMMRR